MDIITQSLQDQMNEVVSHHKITQAKKDANGKLWYKRRIDEHIARSSMGGGLDRAQLKVNYDLFNNILDVSHLMYVTQPYGSKLGETPAKMVNRDIVSTKIKALLGMEIKRPFNWRAVAVNEEAITRKQEEENKRNVEFVTAQIMQPIREKLEIQAQEQAKGKELTAEEQAQVQAQIAQELERMTPDAVRKYMLREHKDPAEVLNEQILNYLIPNLRIRDKFNQGWKHSRLGGGEIYYTGIVNDDPIFKVINLMQFDCDRAAMTSEMDFIEDGEWAIMKYNMSASQIVSYFQDELTDTQITELYKNFTWEGNGGGYPIGNAADLDNHNWSSFDDNGSSWTIPVYHVEFKSLRKIRFLKYLDNETGVAEMIVNDSYKINYDAGDISIEEEWIPEVHEGYRIGSGEGESDTSMYVCLRPVPGQHKDLANLYDCKLSYTGAFYDNMNSVPTATMTRIVDYQYLYNIIMYRIEKLMASDKGKKVMMNINLIPKSMGIDIDKWLYYSDNLDVMFYNPKEEGNKAGTANSSNVGEIAKEIDLSLASQINQYIELADYIDAKCGQSIGVPRQVEGEIAPNDAVTNVKQVIVQSSNVLEPDFELHNVIKANALNRLMEKAKVAYATGKPRKLAHILDDMSMHLIDLTGDNQELLDNNTCGIFVSNSGKAADIKQAIDNLAHAAMQNDKITLSGAIKVMREEGINQAIEILEVDEQKRAIQAQESAVAQEQARGKNEEAARAWEREKIELETKSKLEVQAPKLENDLLKQTVLSVGFNEDKDMDNDNVPDVLEIAKHGLDADIKQQEMALERDKLKHQVEDDKEKNALKEKEIAAKKAQKKGS